MEYREEVPPRLAYMHLIEGLDEEYEILNEGFWHLDGCSGYCPGCFQRPWCEFGTQSCWSEDEEAGTMFLIDSVKKFVCASPISLSILQKRQVEEDKKFEEFKKVKKIWTFILILYSSIQMAKMIYLFKLIYRY